MCELGEVYVHTSVCSPNRTEVLCSDEWWLHCWVLHFASIQN